MGGTKVPQSLTAMSAPQPPSLHAQWGILGKDVLATGVEDQTGPIYIGGINKVKLYKAREMDLQKGREEDLGNYRAG